MKSLARWSLTLFLILSVAPANAYGLDPVAGCGYKHWNIHACPTTTCSISSYAFLDLCSEDSSIYEEDAAAWGFWMWGRESTLSAYLYWDTSACSSASNWYGGNSWNEFDFSPCSGCIGECQQTTYGCSGGHSHFNHTDVRVDSNAGEFSGTNLDDIYDCLTLGAYKEDTFMHEVGHAYGLEHDDTYAHLMHSTGQTHMCNIGAYKHGQPHADDMAGTVALYGRNTNNVKNLSGMAFFTSGGVEQLTNLYLPTYCGSPTIQVDFTIMNYYAALADYSFLVRPALLVETNHNPTAGAAIWTGSNYAVNPSSNPAPHNTTRHHTLNFVVPSSVMSHNTPYRLWLQVDPGGAHTETDEGDNWIPLEVVFIRGSSC